MNEADRGHVADSETLHGDVIQFLNGLKAEERLSGRNTPIVLLGVSWGGKLACSVAAQRPDLCDGLALLYPGLCARIRATAWQNLKLTIATSVGLRRHRVPIPLQDPALFTGDPGWQEFIRRDPLALREVTVSFLAANRKLDRSLASMKHALTRSTLLMLAGKDEIIDNAATKSFVEQHSTGRLAILEYPQARHTLEFEPDRGRFANDLADWLGREFGAGGSSDIGDRRTLFSPSNLP